jgi:hypothetical protein
VIVDPAYFAGRCARIICNGNDIGKVGGSPSKRSA